MANPDPTTCIGEACEAAAGPEATSFMQTILQVTTPVLKILDEKVPDRSLQILIIVSSVLLLIGFLSYWRPIVLQGTLCAFLYLDVYLWFRKTWTLGSILISQAPGEVLTLESIQNLANNSSEAFVILTEILFFTGVAWLIFGIIYQYLPVSLIPNWIPILGSLDEIAAMGVSGIGLIFLCVSIYLQVRNNMTDASGYHVYESAFSFQGELMSFYALPFEKKRIAVQTFADSIFDRILGEK